MLGHISPYRIENSTLFYVQFNVQRVAYLQFVPIGEEEETFTYFLKYCIHKPLLILLLYDDIFWLKIKMYPQENA